MYSTLASAITASSRSSTPSRLDTPRQVFIVRSASGVTTMTQRPVGVPWSMPPPRNVTPTARMSWPKTSPRSSVSTLPMYAARPPKLASPTTVLAAEPPLISTAVPSAL